MRYLLTVIAFIMGFSALPVWAMNCYAEHEGGNTVVIGGNDSNLLIVFYVQIMPDDFVMQLHRF
ncbi:DUF2645 domain-containing protein [Escherichia coli]|nr:hypothetical protein CA896_19335 [Escherichia coli]